MSRRLIPDAATVGLWRLDEAPVSLNPTTISGCVLWLDGQDASTFNAGSPVEGVTVDNWNDKSGSAHHANVKIGTPNYSAAGFNGQPCLHCDGASEALLTTFSFAAPPFTLFAVARYGSGAKGRIISGGGNMLFGWHNGGTWKYYYEGWVENGSGPGDEYAHAICCNMAASGKADFWWDGQPRIIQGSGGSGTSAFGQLNLGRYSGGSEYSDCYIGEVLLFNRILDAGETDRIMAWLNSKWNVYTADVGANVLPATVIGPTKVVVADMPFAHARQFVRTSSQYITVPTHTSFNSADVSFEAWIKMTDLAVNGHLILDTTTGGGGVQWGIDASNNLWLWISAGSRNYSRPSTLSIGSWGYVAGTYDGRYTELFAQGVSLGRYDFGSNADHARTGGNVLIGRSFSGSTYTNGLVADVRLSNRARAPWEIYNTWKGHQARDPAAGFGVEP